MMVGKSGLRIWAVYIFLVLAIPLLPCCAEEVLLATQQPLDLADGTILVVEDVDPQQGVVWLGISGQNGTPDSAVLSLGENFSCSETDIMVSKIYTGGEGDLVTMEIYNESALGMPGSHGPQFPKSAPSFGEKSEKSPGFDAAIPALTMLGCSLIKNI
jgi:hypothetical protein